MGHAEDQRVQLVEGGIVEVDNRLEVHTDPGSDASAPFRHAYRCVLPLGPGASVRPSAATSEIPVGELLP